MTCSDVMAGSDGGAVVLELLGAAAALGYSPSYSWWDQVLQALRRGRVLRTLTESQRAELVGYIKVLSDRTVPLSV